MKKIGALILIGFIALYYFTGRYHMFNQTIDNLQQKFNESIEGKRIGPKS